jgi:prepilin-type N-terminal cleavage/methylation domain-containing protein
MRTAVGRFDMAPRVPGAEVHFLADVADRNGVKMNSTHDTPSTRARHGFTLIELLVVVIILAILSAIIIPQFANATVDASESALDSNLNSLRAAVELYRVQHNGQYPGAAASSGASCAVGTAGAGAANTAAAFTDQLTKYSSASGATCSGTDPGTPLGPYLRKSIPADPISNITPAPIALANAGIPLTPAAAIGGWSTDVKTGQVVMNSNALDSKGRAYSSH